MSVEQISRSQSKTSLVIHVDELLDESHRQTIESVVEQVEGVTQATFNSTRHHLMIVDYDPRRTSSQDILTRVKRQHLHAQLV